jgi:bifunctional non-homologous end joining protein LigD
VPDGPGWAYEIKHDGFRFICRRDGERVRIFSRWGKDWSDKVSAIVEALAGLPVKSATLDGEGVVVDQPGLSGFAQHWPVATGLGQFFLYAFDLIALDGEDMRAHPWEARPCDAGWARAQGMRLSEHLDDGRGKPYSSTRAEWALKASWRSGSTGPIDQAARPVGSRSRTRTRQQRAG